MIIHAYIISFNEEKMIRHTLNHYSKFCEKIFLYDNMSFDRTRELALQYPQVEIRDFESNSIDERNYLKIKNHAWKGSKADYVIVSDTDEFLYAETMHHQLQVLKEMGVTLPQVNGFNMFCDQFPHDYSLPIFDQVKQGVRAMHFDKQIIFDPKKITEIDYLPGCHNCSPKGRLITNATFPFKLLHYKYLGTKYVSQKHESYVKRLSHHNLSRGYGREYMTQDIEKNMKLLQEKATDVI